MENLMTKIQNGEQNLGPSFFTLTLPKIPSNGLNLNSNSDSNSKFCSNCKNSKKENEEKPPPKIEFVVCNSKGECCALEGILTKDCTNFKTICLNGDQEDVSSKFVAYR